jgi:hypothetical protein
VRRRTHVDELTLACGADNRDVNADGGWTTSMNARTECEWAPPPQLDTGQHRINYYHRPDRLTRPPDDDPGTAVGAVAEADDAVEAALPRPQADPDPACVGDPTDPWAHATPTRAPRPNPSTESPNAESAKAEPFDPWAHLTPTRPPQPTADADRPQREPFDPWAHTDTPAIPEPAQSISDAEHHEPSDPLTHTKSTDTDEPEPPQPSGYAECCQPPETRSEMAADTEPLVSMAGSDQPKPGPFLGKDDAETELESHQPIANGKCSAPQPFDLWRDDSPEWPGGPSPPDDRAV